MKHFAVLALALFAACADVPVENRAPAATPIQLDFPQVRRFASQSPGPATRPNAEIARDFLDLAFELESGRPLAILTRFDEPVTVRISGPVNDLTRADLAGLLARLRTEARIDIRLTTAAQANIVIQAIPNRALTRIAPNAACFVVPRVQSWSELRAARGTTTLDWATLDRRDRAAIFIPSDVTPQEIRDCLHEELAQALGPLNDLYRLPDSIFNDDNIHAVLTGFDMLILRAYYDPALRNGMSRDAVAARLPGILARINPRGERGGARAQVKTTQTWKREMENALTDGMSERRRRQAALRAIDIGQRLGWTGPRAGFAQYAYGRLQLGNDPSAALAAFNTANREYATAPETRLHNAFISVQLAAFALLAGDADATIAIADNAIPVVRRHENAALLALLMMFKAEALDHKGETDAGMAVRLDSLGWALYGFGSRDTVVERLNEIASLPPDAAPS